MTSKYTIGVSFLLLLPYLLFSQIEWGKPLITIGERDGLPNTYIKDFEEDEQGFVWILTFGGLCRFDGSYLECLPQDSLAGEGYTDMVYDSLRKTLWLGHYSGVYGYHIPSGKIKLYSKSKVIGHHQVNSLFLDETGDLWVAARGRFARLDLSGDSLQTLPVKIPGIDEVATNELEVVQGDPVKKNRLWLSTAAGLIVYHKDRGEFEYAGDWLKPKARQGVNQIYINPYTQRMYFGFFNRNARSSHSETYYNYAVFDPNTDQFIHAFSISDSWNNLNIVAWNDSTVIFTSSTGMVSYQEKGGKLVPYESGNKGTDRILRVDYIDSHQNVWSVSHEEIQIFGPYSEGVQAFFYESENPGWYHIPTDLYYDQEENSLFLGVIGGEGLYQFHLDNYSWEVYPLLTEDGQLQKASFSHISRMPGKDLHISGPRGMYRLDARGEVVEIQQDSSSRIVVGQAFTDSEGILWNSIGDQMLKMNLSDKTQEKINDEIHYCEAYSADTDYFEDSRNNLWIGGFCGGFDMYDREKGSFVSFDIQPFTAGTSAAGLNEWKGRLWTQSSSGDFLFVDMDHPEKGIVESIPLYESIDKGEIRLNGYRPDPSEFHFGGTMDERGRFWYFTKHNLNCFDRVKGQVDVFDESLGLALYDKELNIFTASLLERLPNGQMVFATRKGICLFDPETLVNPPELPIPYIRNFSVNNKQLITDSTSLVKTTYHLGPTENFWGIDFSAIAFTQPKGVKYLYKMEGIDEEWQDPGARRYVSYSQVKGGKYAFRLKAANASGEWADQEVALDIQLDKFWYQTVWAKVLFALLGIGLILGIYFYRLRQAIQKEQEKNRYERNLAEIKMQALTAQMNPHFIFNSLNSIDFYIIKNNTKKASKYLNNFSRLMRLILSNSRSNYIRLSDDLEALKLYLEIEALRFNHRFSYDIHLDEEIDVDFIKIPPMLIQPYVENAIWHGLLHQKENGKITIEYSYKEEEEVLVCTVTDNGIGREKSMELKTQKESDKGRKSFGMNITKDKIKAMKFLHGIDAQVEVKDLYDGNKNSLGTQVELLIPV